jgi:integrase
VLPVFGDKKPDEVTVADIKTFQINLRTRDKLSKKSIGNIRAAFSAIFRFSIDAEIVDKNPVLLVRAPNKNLFIKFDEEGVAKDYKGNILSDTVNPFRLEDVWRLINSASGQFKNILSVQFFTGMRIGEMAALKWDDIDWNNETIHIQRSNRKDDGSIGFPKNGKTRKVDILPPVAEALKRQFKLTGLKRGYIFLNKDDKRYKNYDSFAQVWKNLLIQNGYDWRTFYQTRHTFASIMLQNGEELIWVSKIMLGHSEVTTTLKHYAKFIVDKKKKRATFLTQKRTNNVQNENLKLESA